MDQCSRLSGHDSPTAVISPGHWRGHGLILGLRCSGVRRCSPASGSRTESGPSRTPAPHGAGVLRGTNPVTPLGCDPGARGGILAVQLQRTCALQDGDLSEIPTHIVGADALDAAAWT